jgi:group I intron endonuclease
MPYGERLTGLYRIVNTASGTCYVGQSQNLHKRMREHLRLLRNGEHVNPRLQNAFSKHGEAAFRFELEITCPPEELDMLEEAFLTGAVHFDEPCAMNIAAFAKAPMRGKRHTAETRMKIRAACSANGARCSTPEARKQFSRAQVARRFADPVFVARVKFIVDNDDMSYADRARMLGRDLSTTRKLALKYAHLKGKL